MDSAGEGAISILARAGFDGFRQIDAEPRRDARGQILIDIAEIGDHARRDLLQLDFRKFKHERGGDVRALAIGLRLPEQRRLAVMIGEQLGAHAQLFALVGVVSSVR